MDAPGFTMYRYFVLNYSNQGAMIWQLKISRRAIVVVSRRTDTDARSETEVIFMFERRASNICCP